MRITISGPIGSGKTTVCALISEMLGIKCVVSGSIFRQMAQELGLSLADFGRQAETNPEYDHLLDERMVQIAREQRDIVLEGRLTAYMLTKNGIPALRVYLDAPLEVRLARVMERERKDTSQAMEELLERENSEAIRYKQYYGIDIRDKSVYDIVIDTGALNPEEVAQRIVKAVRETDAGTD